jgi:hypothetical protein
LPPPPSPPQPASRYNYHHGHNRSSAPPHSVGYSPALPPMHHHQVSYLHDGYRYPQLDYTPVRLAPPRSPYASRYDDALRMSSGGLPKSLSFRKICSRCGRTRSEHSESVGFGNKCTFQDCGKCGADKRLHLSVGCPMGVHCRLAVEQGARPGSADSYRRKLRELAARADLQASLREADRRSPVSMASFSLSRQPPIFGGDRDA